MHLLHGAGMRVPVGDTAFGTRRQHLMVEIIACWNDGDVGPHTAWADRAGKMLEPYALPGGYPNLIGPDHPAQAAVAYGPNAGRLMAAKRRYDPKGVFSATPLP